MRRRAWWVILAAVGLPFTAQAQERAVSGTVKNAVSGVAVRGAEISEVGGRASARSDATGRFTILVPAGALRLQARAIGYHRAEVAVSASDTSVAFALTEDVFQLEAVVVSGQATGIERRFATTAATIVQGQDLNNVPAQTVDKALQGKVPGAYIMQNSGAPGGGMQIQIRGTNTILGSPDPVFVVDGVLYSNASLPSGLSTVTASGSNQGSGQLQDDPVNRLADLNPADIASIQVLRGAAASSIYGSKAANGVVIITTNRGRAGKAEFSITQRFGVSSLLRGPATRSVTEAEALNYYGAASAADTAYIKSFEVNGVLPTYDHLHDVAGQKPLAVETDLTVSGGSQNTRYFLSGSEKQDNGIEPNTGAGRQSLRANIDQTFSDRLSMQFSSAFSRTTTDRGFTNNDNSGASVTYAIAYIPGFIPITPDAKGNFPQPAITYLGSNPLQSATLGTNHEMAVRFVGGSTLTYQAVANDRTNFRIVAAGGLDIFSQRDNVVAPADLYFQQRLTYPGTATISNATSLQWNWNLNAIHAYTAANQSFRATTSVGIQVEDRQLDRDRVTGQGLLPGQIHVDQAAILGNQLQRTEVDRTLAFYGQEEWLGLDQRLNLTAGVRAERNSSNGNTKQYFLYPKLSASYRVVAGEGSEVKLRSAFGETGNHPQFGQKFTTLGTAVIGGNVGTTVGGTAGAPAIKPEQVREI